MLEDVATVDNLQIPVLANRIQQLEEQIKLIDIRLKVQPTVPRLEFVLKVNDEPIWTGLDLPMQFPDIFQKYPEQEITISWRSSPVVWI